MGRKVRKNTVPKAKVIDMSGEGEEKKKVAPPAKGKGRMMVLDEESDEGSDLGAAMAFDNEPDLEVEEGSEDELLDEDDDSFVNEDDSFGSVNADMEGPDSDESVDFEGKVEHAKAQLEAQQAEAAKESMLAAGRKKAHVFGGEGDDDEEEEEEEDDNAEQITLQQRKDRIEEVLKVLDTFDAQREGDHSRREYLDILKEDLKEIYEYSEWLVLKLMELFPPRELFDFLETNEKQRPLTIRVNTLKQSRRDLAQALTRKGMAVEPTGPWCKVGLQIFESDVAVGSTAEYLAGHYLVQSASSFLPVISLDVSENMRVLDMAAAPGGKTTHIAQQMKNTGTLIANDVSAERLVALRGNVLRMGITNCIVTNYNGVGYERVMKNFDRVLLDAPCTGLGVISRDPRIKISKTEKDVTMCASLQKRLILSAIDSCKVGGIVVYSTCSILVEENEATIDHAIRQRNVRVVDTGLPFGRPGMTKYREHRYHASIAMSRRYYPHAFNMDGFYVCKLEKLAHGENKNAPWLNNEPEKKTTKKRKVEASGLPEPPVKVLKRKEAAAASAVKIEKKTASLTVKAAVKKVAEKGVKKERRSRWKRKNQKDKVKKKEGKKEEPKTEEPKKAAPKKKLEKVVVKTAAKKKVVKKKVSKK